MYSLGVRLPLNIRSIYTRMTCKYICILCDNGPKRGMCWQTIELSAVSRPIT